MSTTLAIIIVFILILCSGFFSGSETALTAASKAKMHTRAQDGDWRAQLVNKLLAQGDRLIGALLLGNNLVNILASALATKVMLDLVGDEGVFYATLMMTLLVLIFAEVLPKTYALHNSDKMALFIAPLIRVLVTVFSPITRIITGIVRGLLRLFGIGFEWAGVSSIEELKGAIEMHQGKEDTEDEIVKHERNILRSILELADVTVEEIMTHRRNVEHVDIDAPKSHIVDQVLASPYTRLPLFQGESDNMVGVIHGKHLMRHMRDQEADPEKIDIMALASEPWFIPETTTLFQQMTAFRARREHFAFVVDEYGTFQGIVTLEDILEEIVGEIDDEHDITTEQVRKDTETEGFIVDGTATIRDLNREFEWSLPDEYYATIAGLILYEAKAVPNVGQIFIFFGFRFEIIERKRHQISSIRIIPPQDDD